MKKRRVLIIFGLGLLIAIAFPLLLNWFIFSNDYFSKVSNDGWAGFLGSYIGALVGAAATICAVLSEISHNEKIRKEEQIRQIRPYLYVENIKFDLGNKNLTSSITIKNVGLQAACNIEIKDTRDEADRKYQDISIHQIFLEVNDTKDIQVVLDLSLNYNYIFTMYDISGNYYKQKFRIASSNGIYTGTYSLQPELMEKTYP